MVIAATIMVRDSAALSGADHMVIRFQWPIFRNQAMEIKRRTSPIRLVRAVIIPAPSDLLF